MKKVVLSGIGLHAWGGLSIFYDILREIVSLGINKKYDVVVMVYKKELFTEFKDDVEIIEFPKTKKNYLYRLYYEYIYFNKYSQKNDVYLWLSLLDMSPRVKAEYKAVYCHNASPFIHVKLSEMKYVKWRVLYYRLYKLLYRINIYSNDNIIVQQEWMRQEFENMFKLNNVIVANPRIDIQQQISLHDKIDKNKNVYTFIYASYPRFFKNFEIICEAAKKLSDDGVDNYEVILTIDGSENKYANDLVKKYHNIKSIKFIGLQKREKLEKFYEAADTMIFPSKVETWGLPISEFKKYGKPILAVDLPYAYETVGEYDKVSFFKKNDSLYLSDLMKQCMLKTLKFNGNPAFEYKEPYCNNWNSFLRLILSENSEDKKNEY